MEVAIGYGNCVHTQREDWKEITLPLMDFWCTQKSRMCAPPTVVPKPGRNGEYGTIAQVAERMKRYVPTHMYAQIQEKQSQKIHL